MNFLILAASVIISWTDPNPPEIQVTHYTLHMGIAPILTTPPIQVFTISAPVKQQQIDGLTVGTTYYFRIRVHNVIGASTYSGELVWVAVDWVDPNPTPTPQPTPEPSPPPTPTPEPTPLPTPPPTPEPTPLPTPTPEPTPDLPGLRKGWWKNNPLDL